MIERRVTRLNEILDSFPKLLVAFSGGVDSTCLLQAAQFRLGNRVLGVIADSPSLPRAELQAAIRLAKQMGVLLEVVHTREFEDPNYLSNPANRCYFCKHALFEKMEQLAHQWQFPVLAYGENADDARDWRPGSKAAEEFQIRAPLKEAGLTKADIRLLSVQWGLQTAQKSSSPCLSSRIPHGTPVTAETLAQIETGEEALRKLGFQVFRLRHHGLTARLEFAPNELARAQSPLWRDRVIHTVQASGYQHVEIDPHGYRGTADPIPSAITDP